ncbi:hypothetical protein ACFY8X_11235 [Streptomyces tanashiensis]|uniref:hypothetical protein n=1 Tax=Streptomyces tanashiensis TaxID=67367 RepID=UPI0036E6A887
MRGQHHARLAVEHDRAGRLRVSAERFGEDSATVEVGPRSQQTRGLVRPVSRVRVGRRQQRLELAVPCGLQERLYRAVSPHPVVAFRPGVPSHLSARPAGDALRRLGAAVDDRGDVGERYGEQVKPRMKSPALVLPGVVQNIQQLMESARVGGVPDATHLKHSLSKQHRARDQDELAAETRRFFRGRQRQPHVVRGYFGGPHVRYALDENPMGL